MIKAGECNRVCCGAGGELELVEECTPSNKCEGIKLNTKQEKGHCHGESPGTCKDEECPTDGGKSLTEVHIPALPSITRYHAWEGDK